MSYKYLRDPLFIFCLVLYFVNRWLLKPLFPGGFFNDYLNDLICIPFWVPIMTWGMRKVGARDDDPPHWYEILIPLVVWSVIFEMFLPRLVAFRHLSHADPLDILFYTIGAAFASFFWKVWYPNVPDGRVKV